MKIENAGEGEMSKPSKDAQIVCRNVSYYEYRSCLEFVVWSTAFDGLAKANVFKVPVKMLRASLRRIGPAKRKKATS